MDYEKSPYKWRWDNNESIRARQAAYSKILSPDKKLKPWSVSYSRDIMIAT